MCKLIKNEDREYRIEKKKRIIMIKCENTGIDIRHTNTVTETVIGIDKERERQANKQRFSPT